MVVKAEKQRLKKLLIDAIRLLCKNGLSVESEFRIEATIGITLSDNDILLISFKERVCDDGSVVSQMLTDEETEDSGNAVYCIEDSNDEGSLPCTESHPPTEDQNTSKDESAEGAGSQQYGAQSNTYKVPSTGSNVGNPSPSTSQLPAHDSTDPLAATSDSRYYNNMPVSESTPGFEFSSRAFEHPQAFVGGNGAAVKNEVECANNSMHVKCEQSSTGHANQWNFDEMSGERKQWSSASRGGRMFANRLPALRRPNYRPARGSGRWRRPSSNIVQPDVNALPDLSTAQGANVSRTLQNFCKSLVDQAGTAGSSDGSGGEHVFCQICGARLSSAATLANHIRGTHLSMNVCQCDICGEKFKWTMQLCRHRKRYHADVDNGQMPNLDYSLPLPPYPIATDASAANLPVSQPGPILHF